MGEVWKARDTRLDRIVAIKSLDPPLPITAALQVKLAPGGLCSTSCAGKPTAPRSGWKAKKLNLPSREVGQEGDGPEPARTVPGIENSKVIP